MDTINCDSYCGLYCGACDIMMTYKTGSKHKLAKFWNESTVRTLQNKLGIPYDSTSPFNYKCYGCKSDTVFVNCAVCDIRSCAMDRKVEHCMDCSDYPCKKLIDSKKLEFLLPHLSSVTDNRKMISAVGTRYWLSGQKSRWKCPGCNTPFSWYTKRCSNCGKDLRALTYNFTFWQAMMLKLGILMIRKRNSGNGLKQKKLSGK